MISDIRFILSTGGLVKLQVKTVQAEYKENIGIVLRSRVDLSGTGYGGYPDPELDESEWTDVEIVDGGKGET